MPLVSSAEKSWMDVEIGQRYAFQSVIASISAISVKVCLHCTHCNIVQAFTSYLVLTAVELMAAQNSQHGLRRQFGELRKYRRVNLCQILS